MPRRIRQEFPGAVYYISIDSRPDREAFGDSVDRKRFLQILTTATRRYNLIVHAYVLLDDGYRLLMETPMGNMSRAMQYINSHYMAYRNTRNDQKGRVFSGRYKSNVIQKEKYLLQLCRHIHLLPVFKGLISRPENFQWSSYNAYLQNRFPDFEPSMKDVLMNFDGFLQRKRRKFQRYVDSGMNWSTTEVEKLLRENSILGDDLFVEMVDNIDKKLEPEISESNITPDEIIDRTAEYFKIPRRTIITNEVKPNPPRNLAIYLCRDMMDVSLEDLGKVFGVCSSCICNTAKRVDANVRMGGDMGKTIEELRDHIGTNKEYSTMSI